MSGTNRFRLILLTGFLLRVFFYLVGGRIYYGTSQFTVQGDTLAWMDSIVNLIQHGVYTSNMAVENALFFRPPGYAFFIGLFYLVGGNNMETAVRIIPWVQILLDTVSIWFVFSILKQAGASLRAARWGALLYAVYPFIIVWTPVLYAESTSAFFLLASLHFLYSPKKNSAVWSGIMAGIAVLIRLQCIFIVPFLIWLSFKRDSSTSLTKAAWVHLAVAFGCVYGMWPARNLLLHQRLVFSQDLRIGQHWSPDFLSYVDYILSVKTDHNPQYQQIIDNQPVEWPQESYVNTTDSMKLRKLEGLCKTCGTGFSWFRYSARKLPAPLADSLNCDAEIEQGFRELIESQKANHPLNYYLLVPLSNLKKAIFKFSIYGNKPLVMKIASSGLFLLRTILILAGLFATMLNYRKKWFDPHLGTLILLFFTVWYLYLSFVYRNMEIRYLLLSDLLLLLPLGAWVASFIDNKWGPSPKD